jgi:hypothetical protein
MAKTARYKDGEFIELHWEYGDPDVYYVRGDTFFYGDPDKLDLRHAYAFWAMDGNADIDSVLRECARRPGAFKVTAMDVPTELERGKKQLERLDARVFHRHIRLKSGADGTTWPWPWTTGPFSGSDLEPESAAHKARYAPHTLTPRDAMELASIADAYTTLITHPCQSVRDRLKELHVAYELWCRGILSDSSTKMAADVGAIGTDPPQASDDDQGGSLDRGSLGTPEQDAGIQLRDQRHEVPHREPAP